MPSKSSRAAFRQSQAQHRNRKRKANKSRGPQLVESVSQNTASSGVITADTDVEVEAESTEVQAVSTAPSRSTPTTPVRRSRQRRQAAEPIVFKYLGAELKQIAIISVIMVAILVGLTFVL